MDLKQLHDNAETAKTLAEHQRIINTYITTHSLDRDEAIKKFNDFNTNHPDYYAKMAASSMAAGTLTPIVNVSDDVIVRNLQMQVAYLMEDSLKGGNNHGESKT